MVVDLSRGVFHSHLKTFLFSKSFPPWPSYSLLRLTLWNLTTVYLAVTGSSSIGECGTVSKTFGCSINIVEEIPYSIMSTGHGAEPGFLAVSLQVTLVVNPVVSCRYFQPYPQYLLFQPNRSPPPPLAGTKLYCLVTRGTQIIDVKCK